MYIYIQYLKNYERENASSFYSLKIQGYVVKFHTKDKFNQRRNFKHFYSEGSSEGHLLLIIIALQ